MGENARNILHFIPQNYITYIIEKKWQVGIITFLVGNQLASILSSSGAFEIFCNDVEIWSKIKTNNMPAVESVILSIRNLGYQLSNY